MFLYLFMEFKKVHFVRASDIIFFIYYDFQCLKHCVEMEHFHISLCELKIYFDQSWWLKDETRLFGEIYFGYVSLKGTLFYNELTEIKLVWEESRRYILTQKACSWIFHV